MRLVGTASAMRRAVIVIGLLLAPAMGVALAVLLRPRPQVITLAPRSLWSSTIPDSLQRLTDSMRSLIDARIGQASGRGSLELHIGEPSLVAFLPNSTGLGPDLAELRREFVIALPHAARVAAQWHFRFYVRPSAGLQLWGPDNVPIRWGRADPENVGYLIAAPRFPAVQLLGVYSDSALSEALARYSTLVGMPQHVRKPS